jgi:hypothetical protein
MPARTFGDMKRIIGVWSRENNLEADLVNEALNDAIDALWMACIQVAIDLFAGGPTTLAIGSAAERVQITSISDPSVAPAIALVGQGALAARNLLAAYTLVTDSGSETNLSPTTVLNPGLNQIGQVNAPAENAAAVGWNCYLGLSTDPKLTKQNGDPLPFNANYLEPNAGCAVFPNGPLPPTENTTADDVFYIRHLEVPLTSGGYKAWNQGDFDSDIFRRAARSISSSSEYQNYVWDLVNGRQLEVRPATGIAFSARYFFIHKPRRIRFDLAQLPFTSFPSEEFLKCKSLDPIMLANEEEKLSAAWGAKAEKALSEIKKTLIQRYWGKDQTIAPFIQS